MKKRVESGKVKGSKGDKGSKSSGEKEGITAKLKKRRQISATGSDSAGREKW